MKAKPKRTAFVDGLGGDKTYKNLKKELDEIQNEVQVLARTQAVLEEKAGVVAQSVSAMEKSKGVTGFAHTAETLEHVSNQKGEIDEAKGATLEKISSLVTEINQVCVLRL